MSYPLPDNVRALQKKLLSTRPRRTVPPMKREINHEWIYPPSPDIGRDAIFRQITVATGSQAA